ncbi:MAG: thioesterase domain-containing protein [Syntrophobacterales bacterium]|nr:thioesterase domain-containing protein [Syntrophobacterales bacterium]
MEILAIILALWFMVPFITYTLYWYEVSTPPCSHEGARSEREVLERLLKGDLRLGVFIGLISSIVTIPLLVLLYPLGFYSKLWTTRRDQSLGTVIFIHGLFHNPSGAILFKRAFGRRGFSFISLHYNAWQENIFDVFERLRSKLEEEIERVPEDEPLVIIGHSLGGLLAGLLAKGLYEKGRRVKGVISIMSPFHGSRLAALALGPLSRSLRFGSLELTKVRHRLASPSFPAVQMWSPIDNMVLPVSSLYEIPAGWDRIALPPFCHSGIVLWPGLVKRIVKIVEEWK